MTERGSGGTLTLSGIPGANVGRVFSTGPFVWDARTGAWRCDASHYVEVAERLRRAGSAWEDHVPDWQNVHRPRPQLPSSAPNSRRP